MTPLNVKSTGSSHRSVCVFYALPVVRRVGLDVASQVPRGVLSSPVPLFLTEAPGLFDVAEQDRGFLKDRRGLVRAASQQECQNQ